MKGWVAFAVVVALVLAFAGGMRYGAHLSDTEWQAKTGKEREAAEKAARKTERMWQEVVNGTVSNYQARETRIAMRLDAALGELRQRSPRPAQLPATPVADGACAAGATGAQLYREDGQFLAREAARCESIRGGLKDCYQVIDALQGATHGKDNAAQ